MRKYVYAIALTALAGVSFAAMQPGMGLPLSFTVTDTRGWGTGKAVGGVTADERNGASAMCVECHKVNPSDQLLSISDAGALTIDGTTMSVNMGSHFVINGAANANVFGTTNSGGGNANSFAGVRNDAGYFRKAAWDNGGFSKFGRGDALISVDELGTGYTNAGADMICESCHSLVENVSNGANVTTGDNDLLLGVYLDNTKDSLCTGCHAQNEAAAGRTAFHANNNLKNFGGSTTVRKNHHVMTGDSINPATNYPANPADSYRWAPSFSTILGQDWCITANKFVTANRGAAETIVAATSPTFRDKCNIAGSGTRDIAVPVTLGDIAPVDAANPVNCSNCHRPHNARTNAAAHIFRLGIDTGNALLSVGDFTGVIPAPTGLWATDMYKGIRRQSDLAGGAKVYGEYRPLCMGCHIGY